MRTLFRVAILRLAVLALLVGGCSPAFYLTDYDVPSYTRQLQTEALANDTLSAWQGAVVIIDFDSSGSAPRVASSNLRDIFRERGAFRFMPEMMERAGAQVERELNTWIGPEIASLAGTLGARLERLNRVRLEILDAPVFTFDTGGQAIRFALRVRAGVSGRIYVAEADERYDVTLLVNDYRVTGSLQLGPSHPQGTQVRLRAFPSPGSVSLTGNARREVIDRANRLLVAPLSAPVDVTRTLSYEYFAVPDLRFVQEAPTGGLWTGLARGPAQRGESWSYRTSEWARWVTTPEMLVLAGDFNGDGKADVLKVDVPASGRGTHGLWVGLSNGEQFDTSQWATWTTASTLTVLTGDFNGDGKTDVLLVDPAQAGIWAGISDGRSFRVSRWAPTSVGAAWKIVTGDFNGDRRTDVLLIEVPAAGVQASPLRVGLSDGSGRFTFAAAPWATWDTYRDMKVLAGDFNGDGKTDIMKFDVPSSGIAQLGLWVGLSDGTRFTTSEWARWDTYRDMKVLAGDFNGDGKADVMKFDVPSGGVDQLGLWVGVSDGTRFTASEWARWDTYPDMKVLAGDFNGDGKADVMKFDVAGSDAAALGLWVGVSNGTRFTTSEWARWETYREMKVLAGDFNGDGRTDVMKFDVNGAPPPHIRSSYLARPEVPDAALHVAVRAPSGRIYHGRRLGGVWVGATAVPLAERVAADPALVSAGADRLDTLAIGDSGRLLHARYREGAWTEVATAALPAGMRLDRRRPAVVTTAAGQLEVVTLSADGRLQHLRRLDGRWEPARALPISTFVSSPPWRDPALVQAGNKLVLVFVDPQNRLLGMAFDLETGYWGAAFEIPGPGVSVTRAPAAVACGDGRVDVAYVRRSDGVVAHQPLWATLDVFRPSQGSSGVSYSPATTLGGITATSDPALACSGYRRLELLVTDLNRLLRQNHYTWSAGGADGRTYTVGWQGWEPVGQPLLRSGLTPPPRVLGPVALAATSAGHLHVLAREWGGEDSPRGITTTPQEMWHNSYRADRWGRAPWAAVHWRGWERAGGPVVLGLPALVVSDRHADLVVTGADAGLRQAHVGEGVPSRFVGGRATAVTRYLAEPSALATGPGVVDVLYVGADERLRHLRHLDASLPIDVAADSRPAITAAARPAAVAVGGQLEVVAIGSDRSLWHWRYRQGQWSAPAVIPGSAGAISLPALVNTGAGRLELFAVLGDQRLHHWQFKGAQWTPGRVLASTFSVSATLFGPLSVASWGDGTVDLVAAEASSGRIFHRRVNPGEPATFIARPGIAPPQFVAIGGAATDQIALVALGPGRLSLLTSGPGRTIISASSTPPPTRLLQLTRIGDPPPAPVWRVETLPGPGVVIAGMTAIGARELLAAGVDPQGRLYLNRFRDWRWTGFQLLPGQTPAVQHQPLVPPSLTGR